MAYKCECDFCGKDITELRNGFSHKTIRLEIGMSNFSYFCDLQCTRLWIEAREQAAIAAAGEKGGRI